MTQTTTMAPVKTRIRVPAGRGQRLARRAYDAAQVTRLTSSWTTTSLSADADLYRDLRRLRARSRDLAANNDYGRRFLQMAVTHIVGPAGFGLQVKAKADDGTLDADGNSAVEAAFARWSRRRVCEISRRTGFVGLCQMAVRAVARDGEALIRKVYGRQANAFGFGLQMVDIDRLDIDRNEALPGGNVIRMGVELAPTGEPVAYHLLTRHPGDDVYISGGLRYERVPAADVWHLYLPDRPEQTRGVPWMHASMVRMENLGGFDEAAVIAARVGASKMGFYESETDVTAEGMADGIDDDGTLYSEAEPGVFSLLPKGVKIQSWSPEYPHQAYDAFVKAHLRGIASGLGVAYNSLSNDLEGVNFSSIRAGVLEERDMWMILQGWFIEHFLEELYSDWLRFALLTGQVALPSGMTLDSRRFEKFDAAVWQGRRWQWVDPQKDIAANVTAIDNRLKSRRQVAAEQGRDLDEVWDELKAEKEKAQELGLEAAAPAASPVPPAGKEDDDDAENQDED